MASIHRVGKKWRAQVRRKGHSTWSALFDSKQEAQRAAHAKEFELSEAGRASKRSKITVQELCKSYIKRLEDAGRGMSRNKRSETLAMGRAFKDVRLEDLSKKHIVDWGIAVGGPGGNHPATVGKKLSWLRTAVAYGSVLEDCEKEGERALVAINGAAKALRHLGLMQWMSVERTRRPTEDELARIEAWAADRPKWSFVPLFDMVLFAICTALRQGEISGPGGVLWEDLDIERRRIFVRGRKSPENPDGVDMWVPLLKGPVIYQGQVIDPLEILLRQRGANRRTGRIFPYGQNAIYMKFSRACRECGIEDLHFHDLRHDAISRLFDRNYTIPQVAAVSGHKSWKNLARYTQIDPLLMHDVVAEKS